VRTTRVAVSVRGGDRTKNVSRLMRLSLTLGVLSVLPVVAVSTGPRGDLETKVERELICVV
jgi:hypothetical protein